MAIKIRIPAISVAALLCLAACAAVDEPPPPRQGPIPATNGGAAGYQHGPEGSRFVVGKNARRAVQYGYLKRTGDEGTLAISQGNGSVFGVPDARASSLRMPPFGASPEDHDAFVKDYFAKLGLPADQVDDVRGMTLLEANGRTDEATRTIPRITAYYSVVKRVVDGIPVPDSFAWARANSEGRVVQEAVYWPALPGDVVAEAKRFKEMLSDDERRRAFQARIPADTSEATLAIRHASATENHFETIASLDVTIRSSPAAAKPDDMQKAASSPVGGAALVRHFDINGTERFLPQETLQLKDKYPEGKDGAR